MDYQFRNAFNILSFRIDDGFEFGDWRDQWTTDKSFDELFSARKNIFEGHDWEGRLPSIMNVVSHDVHLFSYKLLN